MGGIKEIEILKLDDEEQDEVKENGKLTTRSNIPNL